MPQSSRVLNLLVVADLHYAHHADSTALLPEREGAMGLELLRRAWLRAKREYGEIHAVAVLGDLVDDGTLPGARDDLADLRHELRPLGATLLVIPGNHDGPPEGMASLFGAQTGFRTVHGCGFVSFADRYDGEDVCTRDMPRMAQVLAEAGEHALEPLIALQHNPIHPQIESNYPFMLADREQVMAAYAEAGVKLSLSGHYHPGQPALSVNGTTYATCPALCESPFGFLVVRIRDGAFEVDRHSLKMPAALRLDDLHCHTEFAYCGRDITAEKVIERSVAFGMRRVFLTEHAGQLYLQPPDFWGASFITDPDVWLRERTSPQARMAGYRELVEPLRCDRVCLGLEVECDGKGRIMLADEDRDGWDILVGAVHYVPESILADPDPAQVAREFLMYTEWVAKAGVHALAHPFRLFRRAKWASHRDPDQIRELARGLYEPVADVLREHGVAAEVNYHTNEPDVEFFALCVDKGVKIALGSDSHHLGEVGEFGPHLALLREIGVDGRLDEVLLRP